MTFIRKTTPSAHAKGVRIGCRYTGRHHAHADTTTGTYWEALPPVEGQALAIQQALLAPVRSKPSNPAAAVHLCVVDPKTGAMRVAA